MEIGGLLGASWILRALKDLRVAGSRASVGGKHTTGWAVLGSKHKGDLLSFGWGGWESGGNPELASSRVGLQPRAIGLLLSLPDFG